MSKKLVRMTATLNPIEEYQKYFLKEKIFQSF
jgi:hypothetical protein